MTITSTEVSTDMPRLNKIVVALKSDIDELALVPHVHEIANFAKRLGAEVDFVSVAEPWDESWQSIYSTVGADYELIKTAESARLEEIKESLGRLKDAAGGYSKISTYASIGLPAQEVLRHTKDHGGDLVVCLSRHRSYTLFPKGFSTVLSLMDELEVPILVFPLDCKTDLSRDRLKMMIADDLTDHSKNAVRYGYWLASRLTHCNISHVHVSPVKRNEIEYFTNAVQEAMNLGRIPQNSDFSYSKVVDMTEKKIRKQLAGNRREYDFKLEETGCQTKENVLFGDVCEELNHTIHENDFDFLVFGQHHFLHKKPLSLGKVPFSTMIKHKCPTLVVRVN